MLYSIVLALFVFVCILLILAVLLQNSKGSDLGSALGGGTSVEMFGPKAPSNIMNKITTVIAAAFLILSFVLALMSGLGKESGVMGGDSNLMKEPAKTAPVSTTAPVNTAPAKAVNQAGDNKTSDNKTK